MVTNVGFPTKKIIIYKGGPGSGHYGHAGRPGTRGGSVAGSIAMSRLTGKDAKERQAAASGKPKQVGGFKPGTPGDEQEDAGAHDIVYGNTVGGNPYDPTSHAASPFGAHAEHIGSAGESYRSEVKAQVIDDLYAKLPPDSGIDKQDVNQVVKQWAYSSNDSDSRSLSLQEAASEEFGIPLSKWQTDSIAKLKADGQWYSYSSTPGQQSKVNSVNGLTRPQERIMLRAMYDNTQEKLAAAGYKPGDSIQLFRGVTIRQEVTDPSSWGGTYTQEIKLPSGVANFQGNSMESWASHTSVAKYFTSFSSANVLSQKVPIENIIGTCRTGFGCLTESEFVVMNVPGTQVTVTNIGRTE